MRRALPWLVLAALAAGAWYARRAEPGAGLGASEVAYRARAVQLALAGGGGLDRDRYLAHPEGAVAPFSPQAAQALAALARSWAGAAGPDARGLEATGGVGQPELERLLLTLPALGGLCACLAAFLALRRQAGAGAALAAAGVQAAAPAWLVAERAGLVLVEPFAAALLCAQFGWLAGARRGADLSAATLSGMLAGICGGLALLATSTALPLVAAAFGLLLARVGTAAAAERADAWRALSMFSMAAVAVALLPPSGASTLSARALLGLQTPGWWARALCPALALCAGLAMRPGAGRMRLLACGLLLALGFLGAPLRAAAAPGGAAEAELLRGLAWMRERTPSPGPFNHAAATQNWCVLSAPELGGLIAYHARRPVVAAAFPTAPAGDRSRAALEVLAATDSAALALALRELGVLYVVVSPGMARAPELAALGPGSAFARLAFATEAAGWPGLERVHASELLVDADGNPPAAGAPGVGPPARFGPAFSIYRAELAPRVPGASSLR